MVRTLKKKTKRGTYIYKYMQRTIFYGHITRFFLTADSFTSQFEIHNLKPDFELLHVMLNVRVAKIKWIGNIV